MFVLVLPPKYHPVGAYTWVRMEPVPSHGLMEGAMKVSGRMASSMECTSVPKVRNDKVNGRKGSEYAGMETRIE
eukprot:208119-Amphidinium_carterae.3